MERTVWTYGKDKRTEYSAAYVRERAGEGGAVHILPIPSTKDGITVFGSSLTLAELSSRAERGDFYITYGIPEEFAAELQRRGAAVYDAAADGEYQEEGAYLTALGTVIKLFGGIGKPPRDMRIAIIGYGRIGRRLSELLFFLGARLIVYSGRRQVLEGLSSLGIRAQDTAELELMRSAEENPFPDIDLLINTAPAPIISARDRANLSGVLVIELASGVNIPEEIPYLRYGGIPAEIFPEAAGISYAACALRAFGNLL